MSSPQLSYIGLLQQIQKVNFVYFLNNFDESRNLNIINLQIRTLSNIREIAQILIRTIECISTRTHFDLPQSRTTLFPHFFIIIPTLIFLFFFLYNLLFDIVL